MTRLQSAQEHKVEATLLHAEIFKIKQRRRKAQLLRLQSQVIDGLFWINPLVTRTLIQLQTVVFISANHC